MEHEKPPILGLIQRGGEPVIRATVAEGTRFFTDEYHSYDRLLSWGYDHRTVYHSRGE